MLSYLLCCFNLNFIDETTDLGSNTDKIYSKSSVSVFEIKGLEYVTMEGIDGGKKITGCYEFDVVNVNDLAYLFELREALILSIS